MTILKLDGRLQAQGLAVWTGGLLGVAFASDLGVMLRENPCARISVTRRDESRLLICASGSAAIYFKSEVKCGGRLLAVRASGR